MSSDLNAYEGVESLHNFNEQSFKLYCENKTLECEKHLAFIRQFINKTFVGSVMEVGSGNGKLLYALERDGFISEAIGYELSSSRVHFANKFGELVGSKKVKNICGDFTNTTRLLPFIYFRCKRAVAFSINFSSCGGK